MLIINCLFSGVNGLLCEIWMVYLLWILDFLFFLFAWLRFYIGKFRNALIRIFWFRALNFLTVWPSLLFLNVLSTLIFAIKLLFVFTEFINLFFKTLLVRIILLILDLWFFTLNFAIILVIAILVLLSFDLNKYFAFWVRVCIKLTAWEIYIHKVNLRGIFNLGVH